MMRLKIPNGVVTSDQTRYLASVVRSCGGVRRGSTHSFNVYCFVYSFNFLFIYFSFNFEESLNTCGMYSTRGGVYGADIGG